MQYFGVPYLPLKYLIQKYTIGKNMEYMENTMKIFTIDMLIYWK